MRRSVALGTFLVALALAAPGAAAAPPTVVSLTFDGGLSSHLGVAAQLRAGNLAGTFFVSSEDVGTEGHLTWAGLTSLQGLGDEIGGMTATGAWLPGLTDAEARHEICDDRDALLRHGLVTRSFAYPYRDSTPSLERIVADCGYDSARGGGGWFDDTLPPRDPFRTLTPPAPTAATTLSDLQDQVTDTIADGAGWTSFAFGDVCRLCGPEAVDPAVLSAFLAWLAGERDAGRVVVRTVGDAIGGPLEPAANLPRGRTVVSLTFDDGWRTQRAAADALDARRMDGTFYVNSASIGDGDRLSWKDLAAFQRAGHEIGSHTQHHPDLRTLGTSALRTEICGDRAALVLHGLAVTSFAYPSSWHTAASEAVVAGCGGLETARTVGGLGCPGCHVAGAVPPANPWVVETADEVLAGTSLADLQRDVTLVEDLGGGWVPIVFHEICDRCGSYGYPLRNLSAFLDWLDRRPATTVVRTVRDAARGR